MAFWLPPGHFDGKGEYVLDSCPGCGRSDKFYFNVDNRLGHCFGSPCTFNTGHVYGFEMLKEACKVAGISGIERSKPAGVSKSALDTKGMENRRLRAQFAWDVRQSREFLLSRGVSEVVSKSIPIWWHEINSSLLIDVDPVSPEYQTTSFYRMLDLPNSKWMPLTGTEKSMYVWGSSYWKKHWGEKGKPFLILVEGIFDILSSGMLGYAVALLGSDISKGVAKWVESMHCPVYLWADPDAAGYKAQEKVAEKLLHWGVKCGIIESTLDPKKCDKAEVRELLSTLTESS